MASISTRWGNIWKTSTVTLLGTPGIAPPGRGRVNRFWVDTGRRHL
jgi:hypothetical protein